MKRLLSLALALIMALGGFSITSSAANYNATWSLTSKIGSYVYDSDDVITVAPGQTVNVTFSLSNNYYTGPMTAQLYYTSSLFSGISKATFNKNGRYYSVCGSSACTCVDWVQMPSENRELGWPNYDSNTLAQFKKTHHFLRVMMYPNSMYSDKTVKSVNEALVTIPFVVSSSATDGSTGEIVLPIETMRTAAYPRGFLFCSVYENESLTSTLHPYDSSQHFDCSKAILKFKVTNKPITLSSESLTVDYKDTAKLDAFVHKGSTTSVNWKSSNTNVATVDKNGNVYATGKGKAEITATTTDGKYSESCNVTVKYSFWQIIIIYCLFGFIWYK